MKRVLPERGGSDGNEECEGMKGMKGVLTESYREGDRMEIKKDDIIS